MLEIILEIKDQQTREILVARLADSGYEAFEEEEFLLKAYIQEDKFVKAELENLIQPFALHYSQNKFEEKNWNEEWEKNFQPVLVKDFCCVRASFHPPQNSVQIDLLINPKMSFGTGHHATTYLMIDMMQDIDFRNKSVFDFGTGTGILAILSEKLGAENILAIDIDDWSIENAEENVMANNCSRINLRKAGNIQTNLPFDIVLANINRNVLLSNMENISLALQESGILLMSGILEADFADIDEKAKKLGLLLSEKRDKNGWITVKYVRLASPA